MASPLLRPLHWLSLQVGTSLEVKKFKHPYQKAHVLAGAGRQAQEAGLPRAAQRLFQRAKEQAEKCTMEVQRSGALAFVQREEARTNAGLLAASKNAAPTAVYDHFGRQAKSAEILEA